MSSRPLVLLHGYSDRGESFEKWRDYFVSQGRGHGDLYRQLCLEDQ